MNARVHAGARTGTSASELSRVALAAAGKCSRPALQKALNLRCKVRPSRARFAATRRKATRQHDRAHCTSIYPSALMPRPPRLNATLRKTKREEPFSRRKCDRSALGRCMLYQ